MAVPLPRSRRSGRAGPGGLPSGHRWTKFAAAVIDRYAGICGVCHHGGARQADHYGEPWTENPGQAWNLADFRPAHGAPGNPCPVCSPLAGRKVHCNQVKGQGSADRARRLIEGWIRENQGGKTLPPGIPPARQDLGRGRDW